MKAFCIQGTIGDASLSLMITQLTSIDEEDRIDYAVSYKNGGEKVTSCLTLDVSRWYPPMLLDDVMPPAYVPEVDVLCHDMLLNYREANAIGEAIMRYQDQEIEAHVRASRGLLEWRNKHERAERTHQ